MRILICTDGSPPAERAGQFGALIARAPGAQVTLLGVVENGRAEMHIREALQRLRALLGEAAHVIQTKLRRGHADDQILAESEATEYDLVIIGSRGRRGLTRFLLGSTAAQLARYARRPLLIVRGERRGLERVLLCTGAEAVSEANAQAAGAIAGLTGAEVTVLHVMSQLPLRPDAPLEDLQESAEEAMAAGTREGQHLQRVIELLRAAGVRGQITPKIRRGLVIDEIFDEIRSGDYDLIVIGAHRAPQETSWRELRELLLDNVADQIITHSDRPVLVVRGREGQV